MPPGGVGAVPAATAGYVGAPLYGLKFEREGGREGGREGDGELERERYNRASAQSVRRPQNRSDVGELAIGTTRKTHHHARTHATHARQRQQMQARLSSARHKGKQTDRAHSTSTCHRPATAKERKTRDDNNNNNHATTTTNNNSRGKRNNNNHNNSSSNKQQQQQQRQNYINYKRTAPSTRCSPRATRPHSTPCVHSTSPSQPIRTCGVIIIKKKLKKIK